MNDPDSRGLPPLTCVSLPLQAHMKNLDHWKTNPMFVDHDGKPLSLWDWSEQYRNVTTDDVGDTWV